MKTAVLIIITILLISGCALSPVAHDDPAEKNISVSQVSVPEVSVNQSESKVNVSKTEKILSKEKIEYTLKNLDISEKKNGVLIRLDYEGDDPKENIKCFFSGDNFFNISLYKGKFSKQVKNMIYNKSIVKTLKFFEFKDSVQITLRFKKEHSTSYIDTDSKTITISVFN